jgi:hypothetical protein
VAAARVADLALQGVLAGHQNRLARDQELLVDGHRRLADAQARFGIGMNGPFPEHLVSVVADRAQISELSAALANTARRDWMTLENLDTDMPVTDDFAQLPLPAYGGRVRCRSIYDASVMEFPVARRVIQACADAGEQARLLPRVPMKMKLADHTTAMLPLTPAGTAGALVIRAPVIIAALREYFEMLWDRATPLRPERGRGSGGAADTGAAGGPGTDGPGAERWRYRPPGRAEYHHGPAAHHGHHDPAGRFQQVRGGRGCAAEGMDRVGPVNYGCHQRGQLGAASDLPGPVSPRPARSSSVTRPATARVSRPTWPAPGSCSCGQPARASRREQQPCSGSSRHARSSSRLRRLRLII